MLDPYTTDHLDKWEWTIPLTPETSNNTPGTPPELPEIEIEKQTPAINEFIWIFQSIWDHQGDRLDVADYTFKITGKKYEFMPSGDQPLFKVEFIENGQTCFNIILPADGTRVGTHGLEGLRRGDEFYTRALLLVLEHIKRAKVSHESGNQTVLQQTRLRVLDALALPRETPSWSSEPTIKDEWLNVSGNSF